MEKETQTDAAETVSKDQGLVYELAFHLLPTLSEDETAKEVAGFKTLLEKSGGTIVSEDVPKSMQLAYEMVKKQEGKNAKFDSSFFGVLRFDLDPSELKAFTDEIDLSKNLLRYLIIKTVRKYEPIQNKPAFREVKSEDSKPISKPVAQTEKQQEKEAEAKPISEEELDKTIEKLVA